MTTEELNGFKKQAKLGGLASTLALKYRQSLPRIQAKYGLRPMRTSFGPTRLPLSSGFSTYNKYIHSVGMQESAGRWNVMNKQSGALGKFQFMPKTLRGLGYKGTTQQFLRSPKLQTHYMHKFTQENARALNINLNKLTPQGVRYLSAAHYGGVGGARRLMKGDFKYGNTAFYNKTPYSYVNDMMRRVYGR